MNSINFAYICWYLNNTVDMIIGVLLFLLLVKKTGWCVTSPFRKANTWQEMWWISTFWSWNVNLSILEPQKFRRKPLVPRGKNDLANWESARDKSMHASPQLFWLFWKSSCFQREPKVIPPGKVDGVTPMYWFIMAPYKSPPFWEWLAICFRWVWRFEAWDFKVSSRKPYIISTKTRTVRQKNTRVKYVLK